MERKKPFSSQTRSTTPTITFARQSLRRVPGPTMSMTTGSRPTTETSQRTFRTAGTTTPLTWLGQEYKWRCPACFPEFFPGKPMVHLESATIEQLADEIERRGGAFATDLAHLLQQRYMARGGPPAASSAEGGRSCLDVNEDLGNRPRWWTDFLGPHHLEWAYPAKVGLPLTYAACDQLLC